MNAVKHALPPLGLHLAAGARFADHRQEVIATSRLSDEGFMVWVAAGGDAEYVVANGRCYPLACAGALATVLRQEAAEQMLGAIWAAWQHGQHDDGCRWWETPVSELAHASGREAAEGACDCWKGKARLAIAAATGSGS